MANTDTSLFPTRRATRRDVANQAGVSPTAVTAVLTGRYPNVQVREETRQRILDATRQLNYKPSLQAQGLKEQRTMLLGFLCRQVYRRSHEIMLGMQGSLESTEYSIVHYSRGDTLEAELRHLHLCWERGVDGIALTPMLTADGRTNVRQVLELVQSGVPVVQVPNDTLPEVPSVTFDLAAAGELAASHLIDLGHRRIALLVAENYDNPRDPAQQAHPRQVVHGVRRSLGQAGIEPRLMHYPSGYATWGKFNDLLAMREMLAQRLMEDPERPTAVICNDDHIGLALLRALGEMNLCVPRDMSVIGIHNTRSALASVPSLSSVELHHERLGEVSADLILRQVKGQPVHNRWVTPTLVPRESTAAPGK